MGTPLKNRVWRGSEKEGTVAELWLASPAIRLLNPFGGSAVGGPECPPFFFRNHRRAEGPWALLHGRGSVGGAKLEVFSASLVGRRTMGTR
jgi:hypothetical protein